MTEQTQTYTIVRAYLIEDLEDAVQCLKDKGWVEQGGIALEHNPETKWAASSTTYYQAMRLPPQEIKLAWESGAVLGNLKGWDEEWEKSHESESRIGVNHAIITLAEI